MAFRFRKASSRADDLNKGLHTRTPLVDDPAVKEVFASELVSVTATGDTVTMTLCASRTTMDWPELKIQRVVTARLVIPANTALNLCARIQQVLHQKQLLETVKGRKLS